MLCTQFICKYAAVMCSAFDKQQIEKHIQQTTYYLLTDLILCDIPISVMMASVAQLGFREQLWGISGKKLVPFTFNPILIPTK